jgi:hypothetical protein
MRAWNGEAGPGAVIRTIGILSTLQDFVNTTLQECPNKNGRKVKSMEGIRGK